MGQGVGWGVCYGAEHDEAGAELWGCAMGQDGGSGRCA